MAMLPLEPTYRVSELLDAADDALRCAFGDEVWVEGEIRGLSGTGREGAGPGAPRHVFFDLIEASEPGSSDQGAPRAVLAVKLFDAARRRVNVELRRHGQVRMTDGVRVRIRGRIGVWPRRSQLELQMTGIDPGFTLAALMSERDRVLALLAAEGLDGMNRAHPAPTAPVRIGLVTSRGSAAASDFLHELTSSGVSFEVTLVESLVQGPDAPRSLATAIRRCSSARVEVIAVVRGGGARTDLAAFDTEPVARAIAAAPVPVWTGIGHEIDQSAADLVAHRAHKTPTACAAALVESVRIELRRAEDAWGHIARTAWHRTTGEHHRLDGRARQVVTATNARLHGARWRLRASTERLDTVAPRTMERRELELAGVLRTLGRVGQTSLREAERLLDTHEARREASDPQHLMRRGWTIVTDRAGKVQRSAGALAADHDLLLHFLDGEVPVTVTGPTGPSTGEGDGHDEPAPR